MVLFSKSDEAEPFGYVLYSFWLSFAEFTLKQNFNCQAAYENFSPFVFVSVISVYEFYAEDAGEYFSGLYLAYFRFLRR